MRKGCSGARKIAILPQFLPIDPHFVRKGCSSTSKIAILPQFLPIDPHFVRKGCSSTSKIAILPQFLTIDPHFVRKGWRFVTPRRHHPRPKERKIKKARERKGREKGERERRERKERGKRRESERKRRCEDEKVWEKVWRWEDVKRSRCEEEQMWRGADVKMRRCEDEKMWRWADVKMRRCEKRCEDEKMWRWEGVREGVKMRRCEDEKVWEKMWRWEGVKMRRCEDEKMWRWADVKMRRCEKRCEDEKMWRWEGVREGVKMRRCEDEKVWEKMWRWEGVKMRRCEDEQMWRWADVKMRRCERRCEDEKAWRWEDEIQTPTIGRTLRSDALGNERFCSFPRQRRKNNREWRRDRWEAQSKHFAQDFLTSSQLVTPKSAFSYELRQNRYFVRGFRQFSSPATSLPRNLHVVATFTQLWQWDSWDSQKTCNTTRLKCCACHAKWRWRSPCKVLRHANHLLKTVHKYCACHRERPSTHYENCWRCHKVPRLPPRNEVAQCLKPSKVTTFAALRIGTAVATSCGHLRTVASGCGQLRAVANGCRRKRNV